MTVNSYINNPDNAHPNFQNEIEKLWIESIQYAGMDLEYAPRTQENLDYLYGENTMSSFNSSHTIEMYLKNVDGFEGDGDFISAFGFEVRDNAVFQCSKQRFETEMEGIRDKPKEGDLIYFPLTKSYFEITHVERENPFYQTSKLFIYEITVELFQFSQEDFSTGNEEIDKIMDDFDTEADENNDSGSDNEKIEDEADDLEFNEQNPFGHF